MAAVSLPQYLQERSAILHEDFYALDRAASLRHLASGTLGFAVVLLLGGLIPAVVGSLLRQPLLWRP